MPPQDYFDDPQFQQLEAAFHDYVAQGDGRNVTWLSARTGLPLAVCAKGMVKGFWLQRIGSIGRDAAKAVREQLVGDVAGLNSRDVGTLSELIELTDAKLKTMIETDQVKPDLMWRINETARRIRAERLGIGVGQEGDLMARMAKLLEASSTEGTAPAKPFVLDRAKLATPPELPNMPGMTSDADDPDEPDDGERRDLDEEEKESLRG
jgi:hypothetical protein